MNVSDNLVKSISDFVSKYNREPNVIIINEYLCTHLISDWEKIAGYSKEKIEEISQSNILFMGIPVYRSNDVQTYNIY